jgi:hypothetical protein
MANSPDAVFRLRPDIFASEIVLPVVNGTRVTRVLSDAQIQTRIIILTGIWTFLSSERRWPQVRRRTLLRPEC